MKKPRISLAVIISAISAFIFSFVCFLSFLLFLNGELRKSVLSAVIICLLLLLQVYILKRIKSVRRNFQRNAIFEFVALLIYIIVAVVLIIPFSHYFTVIERKEDIKRKLVSDLDNTIKMFNEYEVYANNRISLYEYQLETAIDGKDLNPGDFIAAGFQDNGESFDTQKKRLVLIFKDDLMPAQYDTLKFYATQTLNNDKKTAMDWYIPIRLLKVVNKRNEEANKWLSELKDYANSTQKAIVAPFEYRISFTSVERELNQRGTPSLFAIISAIILQVLILFPYFFTYRNPQHPGLLKQLSERETEKGDVGKAL